ncbi:hypothetical protein A2592_01455 [Candidatus Kaiserbacteria bacterium RIFOXYD1_FULL_42_15]|uniref:HTH cro/C1-type domain-containing protein n=1 Tax=Candidatus Kaiserbacteria bacterium RIFOXYD1_FULL_42_15 TaxID=1798532 RepID=A0A1F6FPX5_9BACT|nr:MAG: hypothetical protein A2592_01455 [Candidatus Kaiserbacteria bacterium RIFOXYD1_FULL_42_15]
MKKIKNKRITSEELHELLLKEPGYKEAYDALELEFSIARMLIDKRIKEGLTQKELAEKIGTRQSVISNLEGGEANPTLATLRKVADALGAKVMVTLR